MSPDPNSLKASNCVSNQSESIEIKTDCEDNATTCQASNSNIRQSLIISNISMANIEGKKCKDALNKMPMLTDREKRNVSPTSCILNDTFLDPQSPSSSSSTSQATSANDITFEPTIEMMVNDFDDEQTLNEEEALASLESQDADDEIDTLKKESEMPLEELLAKYRALPPSSIYSEPLRKKPKKTPSYRVKPKQKQEIYLKQTSAKQNENIENSKLAKADSEYLDEEIGKRNQFMGNIKTGDFNEKLLLESVQSQEKLSIVTVNPPTEISKVRRSHLLDLYPEGTFGGNETTTGNSKGKFHQTNVQTIECLRNKRLHKHMK